MPKLQRIICMDDRRTDAHMEGNVMSHTISDSAWSLFKHDGNLTDFLIQYNKMNFFKMHPLLKPYNLFYRNGVAF